MNLEMNFKEITMKWMKALFMGKMVFDIISQTIPKALNDGKLTIDEILDILKQVCKTFDIHIEFNIPDHASNLVIDVIEKVDSTIKKLP